MNNFTLKRNIVMMLILILLVVFIAVPLVKVRFDTIYNIDYIVKNIEKIEITGLNKENINERTIITSRDDINLIFNNLSNEKLRKTVLYFETDLNSKSSDTSIHIFMEDGSVNTIKSNYMVWYNHSSSFLGFFRHPFAVGNCSIYEFATDLHIETLITN